MLNFFVRLLFLGIFFACTLNHRLFASGNSGKAEMKPDLSALRFCFEKLLEDPRLQLQDRQELSHLLALAPCCSEVMEVCGVCNEPLHSKDEPCHRVRGCQHSFHLSCLHQGIRTELEGHRLPRCLGRGQLGQQCSQVFSTQDMAQALEASERKYILLERCLLLLPQLTQADQSSCLARASQHGPLDQKLCSICQDHILLREPCFVVRACQQHFHKACLTKSMKMALAAGQIPRCPGSSDEPNCSSTFSLGDMQSLEDGEESCLALLSAILQQNSKLRLCPQCHHHLAYSPAHQWVQTCASCQAQLCFNCGQRHPAGVYCWATDSETYRVLSEAFFNDPERQTATWVHCPYCQNLCEKKEGCDQIICGSNAHDGYILSGHGCAKRFDYTTAKVFVPEASVAAKYQVEDTGQNQGREENGQAPVCWRRPLLSLFALSLPASAMYGMVHYSQKAQGVAEKNLHLRNRYCHTQFPEADSNCIDLSCLEPSGLSICEYRACYMDLNCWKAPDNPYTVCYDQRCRKYQLNCARYQKYYRDKRKGHAGKHHTYAERKNGGYICAAIAFGILIFPSFIYCCMLLDEGPLLP